MANQAVVFADDHHLLYERDLQGFGNSLVTGRQPLLCLVRSNFGTLVLRGMAHTTGSPSLSELDRHVLGGKLSATDSLASHSASCPGVGSCLSFGHWLNHGAGRIPLLHVVPLLALGSVGELDAQQSRLLIFF